MSHSAYIFDAYGTLFDVHAAVRKYAAAVGPDSSRLSAVWREKQLEYSWTRSLMGQYADFWELTKEALDTAYQIVPGCDPSVKKDLLDAYWHMDTYPEVPEVLKSLKEQGARLAILSNGSPAMLEAAVNAAGMTYVFDEVFSVDTLRKFKPDPDVYDMVTTHFRLYPQACSFQSSNRWDIAGASKFGMRTVWINRFNVPDEYQDLSPAAVLTSLDGLIALG
ncbi:MULTISPECIES: haloacid dehalogenase type II [Pseudovibrio]|uniref:haloacid dehalogenase type II n=1 Tax=Stappiaceae TaxID=2821832 RepID=UPI0023652327|nr:MULTISPECIES: haloacid dehalogenase type II [Pseudovibrio]MDD7909182.1 haloacid dehalogenase type II [Pseudovibrio exalbescens]MDX5595273.1 haloacid dehalogenase type II [Pseudovibrio sp. SPO723]